MSDQGISRRLFSAAGLAALGTAILGPRDALAQPPSKRRRKRLPRDFAQQQAEPANLPPITGLEVEINAMRNGAQGLYLELFLVNHSENAYNISEPKFSRQNPALALHAFGQDFEMRTRAIIEQSRRAMISRVMPWRHVQLPPKNKKKREPSRLLYAAYTADWTEELSKHVQHLQEVPAFLTATFRHQNFEERGLEEALVSNRLSLHGLQSRPPQAPSKNAKPYRKKNIKILG